MGKWFTLNEGINVPYHVFETLFLCKQVRVLVKQLDEMQAGKQELVLKYEGQLQHMKEEVGLTKDDIFLLFYFYFSA